MVIFRKRRKLELEYVGGPRKLYWTDGFEGGCGGSEASGPSNYDSDWDNNMETDGVPHGLCSGGESCKESMLHIKSETIGSKLDKDEPLLDPAK